MKTITAWLFIVCAVLIAVLTNSVSAIWAKSDDKLSIWLLLLILLSPMVFITFGLVTSRIGLAVTSGVIDSLLTLITIAIGLFIFGEWNKVSSLQYVGMGLAIGGIILMLFFPKLEP